MKKKKKNCEPIFEKRFLSTFSYKGATAFYKTFETLADKIYTLPYACGAANLAIARIAEEANNKLYPVTVFADPLLPQTVMGAVFPTEKLAVLALSPTFEAAETKEFAPFRGSTLTDITDGAADGAFILQKKKRTDSNAVLSVVGRDQQDQELLLQFDHEKCVWKLIKAETEVWRTPPDPVLLSVSKLVTPLSPEWRGTPSELHAQLADVPLLTHVLTRHLNANADLLYNDYGILYKTKRSHANRIIILTLEKAKA